MSERNKDIIGDDENIAASSRGRYYDIHKEVDQVVKNAMLIPHKISPEGFFSMAYLSCQAARIMREEDLNKADTLQALSDKFTNVYSLLDEGFLQGDLSTIYISRSQFMILKSGLYRLFNQTNVEVKNLIRSALDELNRAHSEAIFED